LKSFQSVVQEARSGSGIHINRGNDSVNQLEGEAGSLESSSANGGESELRHRFLFKLSDFLGRKPLSWGHANWVYSCVGQTSAIPP